MSIPRCALLWHHAQTGGTGVVRRSSTRKTDLRPEVHRSSNTRVPEQCGSVTASAGCPARAHVWSGAARASAAEGAGPVLHHS